MRVRFRSMMIYALTILLILPQTYVAQAQVADQTPSPEMPPLIRSLSEELGRSGPNDFPTRVSKDTFGFLRQGVRVAHFQRDFNRSNSLLQGSTDRRLDEKIYSIVETPDMPGIGDFDKEVSIEVDPGAKISLVLTKMDRSGAITKYYHDYAEMDVVAFARDRELLTVVERSGKVSVVDMGLAVTNAFRGPVPMMELTTIPQKLMRGNLHSNYLTRGLNYKKVSGDALVPLDQEQKAVLEAGNLVLYNETETVAILDRNVIRTQLYTGEFVLSVLAAIVSPTAENLRLLSDMVGGKSSDQRVDEKVRSEIEAARAKLLASAHSARDELDPLEAEVFRALPIEQLRNMVARGASNKQQAAKRRDRMTERHWQKSSGNIQVQAQSELDSYNQESANVIQSVLTKFRNLADTNRPTRESLEQGFENGNFSGPANGTRQPLWKNLTARQLEGNVKKGLFGGLTRKALVTIAVILAGGGATLSSKSVIDGNGPAWAVRAANDLYDSYWPAVLKDAAYRITVMKHSLAMTAFIPAMHIIGTLASKSSRFLGWSAHTVQARMAMVVHATTVLPFYHYLARLARQPNYVAAMQRGISPFRKIETADGESFRAGFTNPFLPREKRNRQVESRRQAIDQVARQDGRTESLAFSLAAMTFAAEAGVDPATLILLASQNGLNEETIKKLNTDPYREPLQKEWYKIAREVNIQLSSIVELHGKNVANLKESELLSAFQLAASAAAKIKSVQKQSPAIQGTLQEMRFTFRQMLKNARIIRWNFAVDEVKFLLAAEPSNLVVRQFWKQFTTDFFLSVNQMSMFGARADMANPQYLAADPNGFLWTSKPHLGDMVDQVRIYNITLPGSLALVYQRAAAIVENSYEPIQDMTMRGSVKMESFLGAMGTWVRGAADLENAKFGHVFWRDFIKGAKTVQNILLFVVGGRIVLAQQDPLVALLATIQVWFWGRFQYAAVWPIITRGNQVYEEKTEELRDEYMNLKTDLDQAIQFQDSRAQADAMVRIMEFSRRQEADLPEIFKNFESGARAFLEHPPSEAAINEARRDLLENSQMVLTHALANPAVPNTMNPKVDWATNIFGAVFSTYFATILFAHSYVDLSYMQWVIRDIQYIGLTMGVMGALYAMDDFVIPAAAKKWRSFKVELPDLIVMMKGFFKKDDPKGPSCFGPLNR